MTELSLSPNDPGLTRAQTPQMIAVDAQVVTASAPRVERRVSQPAAQRGHHQPRRSEA